MKKLYIPFLVLLCAHTNMLAQAAFQKFYGSASNADFGADLQRTADGNFFVLGTSATTDKGYDFFLLQTDSLGATIGVETYGGTKNEMAQRLVPLADGGHLLLGYTESFGNGGRDGYALRTNALGSVVWSKTVGGLYDDFISDGLQLPDGSFIIATNIYTLSNGYNIRIEHWDAAGNALAIRNIVSPQQDICRRMLATADGQILLAGIYNELGFISKIESNSLAEVWLQTYTSANSSQQMLIRMEDIIADEADQFIAVGRSIAPSINTVITLDGNGDALSKFNTVLSGAVGERLARNEAGVLFVAGGGVIERYDEEHNLMMQSTAFDIPFDVPARINGLAALSGGDVALVGNTQVYQNGRDAMLSQLDTALAPQWSRLQQTLGPDDTDSGYSARQTPDGGYLLYGEKYNADTRQDAHLIKTDPLGNVVWQSSFGTPDIELVRTMDLSGNNAAVATGFSYDAENQEDAVLFVRKVNLFGNTIWAQNFPLETTNFAPYTLIRSLADGGYIVAFSGALLSELRKPTLLRLDANGNYLWAKIYTTFSANNFLRNILETPEGNLLITGASVEGVIQTAMLDAAGTTLWSQTYGGPAGVGYGLAATPEGQYMLSGFTNTDNVGNDSLYLAKIDALGSVLWEEFFEGGSYVWPRVHVNNAGEILLSATVSQPDASGVGSVSFVEIRKLDPEGTPIWTREIGDVDNLLIFESHLTNDGGMMLFGYADRMNSRDFYLIKTNENGLVNSTTLLNDANAALQLSPVPAHKDLNIKWTNAYLGELTMSIFDANGREVQTTNQIKNNAVFEAQIEVGDLPAGAYFLQLLSSEGLIAQPFIKQ